MSATPTYLYLIFHGPWGFAVDLDSKNTISALTPECEGHQYWMANGPILQPMPRGNYAFTDESGLASTPNPDTSDVLTELDATPPRLTVPGPGEDSRVHCRLFLPATNLIGCALSPRGLPDDTGVGDDLLSGRHFSLLNHTDKTTTVNLAFVQVARYQIPSPGPLQLLGDGGGAPLNLDSSSGDLKLHFYAETNQITDADHFAMMAALFNLDLHLDGTSLLKQSPNFTPPAGLVLSSNDLQGVLSPWLERTGSPIRRSRMAKYPPICGYSIVIKYNSTAVIPPGNQM